MNEQEKIRQINTILGRIDRMNDQIEINTRKLNDAIKEMRGLVGFVRPLAKKNAWYGEEIEAEGNKINSIEINNVEYKSLS